MSSSSRPCPVCDTETAGGRGGLFIRCDGCGVLLRRQNEHVAVQQLHDELYFGERDRIEMTPRLLLEQYVAFVDERCGLRGAKVVDFGCGTAPTGHLVSARGAASYVGVEFSAEARREVRSDGLKVVASLDEVGDRRFDVAFMIEVIEHLSDPVAVLQEIHQSLAADGCLFVVTPNVAGLKSRVHGDAWEQAALSAHVVLFDAPSLRETLERGGFEVVARQRWIDHGRSGPIRLGHVLLQALGLDGGLRFLAAPSAR